MGELKVNSGVIGMNLQNIPSQIKQGQLSFALNAVIEGFDGNSVTYQNELANELCTGLPEGYKVVGRKPFPSQNKIILWLSNPTTEDSEIGVVKDCKYEKTINDSCLNLSIHHPIKTAVTRKNEVYWTDGNNLLRWLDFDNLPYKEEKSIDGCDNTITSEIDCNKLNVQPNFSIPNIEFVSIESDGELTAGTYQFAIAYSDEQGNPYTAFHSITNPISIHDDLKVTNDFNYPVNKSIVLDIQHLEEFINFKFTVLSAIKTVNNTTTFELVGIYEVTDNVKRVVYTGQKLRDLSPEEVMSKYPIYSTATSVYSVQDVLGWVSPKEMERINYQKIFNKLTLYWQTHKIKGDKGYKDPINTATKRSYMRDEVYALEGVFLTKRGGQSDRFVIPARASKPVDLEIISNKDVVGDSTEKCENIEPQPRWKVYNTASLLGFEQEYLDNKDDDCWEGPYQYGEFAFHQSTELYDCDESVWGDLAGQPIRHHRFPDNLITNHFDNQGNIYPIGIKLDLNQLVTLINESDLTQEQKDNIVGIKIVRGNRAANKSIKAKGLLTNVLKYTSNDRIIPTRDSAGAPVDPVIGSIDTALDMLTRADLKLLLNNPAEHLKVKEIRNLLTALKNLEIGTPAFTAQATLINNKMLEVLDADLEDTAYSYVSSAQQIVQGLLDSSTNIQAGLEEENTDTIDYSVKTDGIHYFPNYLFNDVRERDPFIDNIIYDEDAKSRFTLHSPDTSFFQPTLGNILKIESVQYGKSTSHIVETQKHARYQFVNSNAYLAALISGAAVGIASGQYGVSTQPFDGAAAFIAYQALLTIIYKVTPRRNFAHQFNSVGEYSHSIGVPNNGNKQRTVDIAAYLLAGHFNVGDKHNINNYQRESSVYLRTTDSLPYTHENVNAPQDRSKMLFPDYDLHEAPISSYYASLKTPFANQWGQVYSYESVDTGFQFNIEDKTIVYPTVTVFGGDIFINKFAFKKKFPFFLDHRVGAQDDSDVFYNELSNVGRVKYWFSTDATKNNGLFKSIFGVKPHRFFWQRNKFFNDYGNIFLFAYAIPYFWCESEVNVDMRQAFNGKEGDFFPHVSSGIPDDWLQEHNVSIQHDNTYHYNKSYSKQNKENYFSFIPNNFKELEKRELERRYSFRTFYSEKETNAPRNNWLIYRPVSYFDFPENNGKLISVDSLEDSAVLVRFENKSQIYNAHLTINTSGPQAVYLGNSDLFKGSKPLDFAETELGFNGTQNYMLLKTPYGHVSTDAKRGKVFLISGTNAQDLTGPESNAQAFFERHLPFEILESFPDFDIDNHFNFVGLHGVYNTKRFILTKLDYVPLSNLIRYENKKFWINDREIFLYDPTYFCNKSFTISFDFTIRAWCSFHSYFPNYYIGENEVFYSGLNNTVNGLWSHGTDISKYNKYYGTIHPYILEYPIFYDKDDEILQFVQDYTKVQQVKGVKSVVASHDVYFNKAIIYNDEQTTGLLELIATPEKNLFEKRKYPKYFPDKKQILFSKTGNFYNYNTFWNILKDSTEPIFLEGCTVLDKELNESNLDYSNRIFKKEPIRGKDCKIRHILDNKEDYRLTSQFIITESQKSII